MAVTAVVFFVSNNSIFAEVENVFTLPRYTIDGITYALNTESKQDDWEYYKYVGAIVVPDDDNKTIFSGKVTIPQTVLIDGVEYPVYAFVGLSSETENVSKNVELVLQDGIKVIGVYPIMSVSCIKSMSIPQTVEVIYGMPYYVSGELVIPSSTKLIGHQAYVGADKLFLSDGIRSCQSYSIVCDNTTLTIPGSMRIGLNAIIATKLENLVITKSASKYLSPYFGMQFCYSSYGIKTIKCEYDIPPSTSTDAFRLEPSIADPMYPEDDNLDGYNPGMYDRATLYVPKAAIEAYKADAEWGRFKNILAIEDGVDDISADAAEVVATEYYDLSGRRLEAPAERGITITATIYSDGTRRCAKTVR